MESSGKETAKKATIVLVSKTVSRLVTVLSTLVLVRVLSKKDFGLLQFVLLAYLTVSTLAQLGLPESVFYFFEIIAKDSRKKFVFLLTKLLCLLGLIGSSFLIILTFVAPYWGFQVKWLFLPLILLTILDLPASLTPNVLVAVDKVKHAAWFNLSTSALLFCATVLPPVLGLKIDIIIIALVFYGCIRFVLSAIFVLPNFRESDGGVLPTRIIRSVFDYSVPLAIATILWNLNRTIDKYIVAAFMPRDIFAEYTIGAWEIPFVPTIAYSVAMVMMPQFVAAHLRGDKDGLLKMWFQSINKVSLVILPVMVLFILIAQEFIVLAFSEKYINATLPFQIYTLILFQRVTSYGAILKAVGDTKSITKHAIYIILINVALSIPLILTMGIAGPPTAAFIASFVTWFYLLVKIKSALDIKFKQVFPFARYLKILLVSVIAGIPVLVYAKYFEFSHQVDLIAKVIIYFLDYGIIATMSGVCSKADWMFVFEMLGFKRKKKV